MFYSKRALGVGILCVGLAATACAFDFSYGTFFEVKNVKNKDGVLQLPLSRKKYKNVKVLSKELYGFLKQCSENCKYPAQNTLFRTEEFRQAATNEQLFIADISFNDEILLTFLVFNNPDKIRVKFPEAVLFTDENLKKSIEKFIKQQAEQIQ